MSVERVSRKSGVAWRVRWRDPGGRNRSRVLGRKEDAVAFEAEVKRRRRTGELSTLDAGRITLDEYVAGRWLHAHAAHLAPKTRRNYATLYDRHISPRVGAHRLNEIDPEVIAGFQADLIRAGARPHAIQKSMILLGGILQRAAETRRIPYNPQRVVRKARLPPAREVRPIPPSEVECIRWEFPDRDATLVSVLAYAGLRPVEIRALRWRDVGARTILINSAKTDQRRNVRLLSPLADDLQAWRRAADAASDKDYVFPRHDGEAWTANAFGNWRRRSFYPALIRAGLERFRPYDLRHSFASLLLHEGRSVIYVARQLGHGAELTMRTYGHVIEELEEYPRQRAQEAIVAAREKLVVAESPGSGPRGVDSLQGE
jgi:integrase